MDNIWELDALYKQIENELTPELLESKTDDELKELYDFISGKEEWYRYNKLATFEPYDYQNKWYEASKHYRQRYLSASNRIGKSYGEAMAFAQHVTGLYRPDWPGVKIEETGTYWCVGISQDAVNNVLAKELLGVSDCRNLEMLGTGAIPRECINIESMAKDGQRCISVRIKHVSGKENTIMFYASTQNESVMMGQTCLYVWFDEQMPNETDLYNQAVTRTLTTKGHICVTATPELGPSDLWRKFSEDASGKLYFQNATWGDCPHITEDDIEEIRASCSKAKFEMRSKGLPILGEGAVFDFSEDDINSSLIVQDVQEKPYKYKVIWGCDFGYASTESADPSTLVLCAWDKEEDVIHVIKEWNSKADLSKDALANMPPYMAQIIKDSEFPNAPLIVPHDGTKGIEGTNTTRLAEFRKLGINVLPEVFSIPYQLHSGAMGAPKHPRSLDWTIGYCQMGFHKGQLKLNVKKLPELMKEYRLYQYKDNGKPIDKNNHHLDAMRYAVVSIKHKGWDAYKCTSIPVDRWAASRDANKQLKSRNRF